MKVKWARALLTFSVLTGIGQANSSRLAQIQNEASRLYEQREYSLAAERYQKVRELALNQQDRLLAARSLSWIANCHFRLYQYREAVRLYEEVNREAKELGDYALERVVASNIASLWNTLGETERARRFIGRYPIDGTGLRPESRLEWHLVLVQIHGRARDRNTYDKAVKLALEEAAKAVPSSLREAAEERLRRHSEGLGELRRAAVLDVVSDAEVDFGDLGRAALYAEEAYRIRAVFGDPLRVRSLVQMAVLARKQGNLEAALRLASTAIGLRELKPSPMQSFRMHREKGLALMAMGRAAESLEEFRRALAFPRTWRGEVLPSDSALYHFEAYLTGEVHRDFLNAVIQLPERQRTQALAAETFWVAEEARFAAIRAAYFPRDEIAKRLGTRYWPLLKRFQELQEKVLAGGAGARGERDRLESELVQMEESAGLSIPHGGEMPREAFGDWQRRIPRDETVFSYFLSEPQSLAWVVNRRAIEMRVLPGRKEIRALTNGFTEAVRRNDRDVMRSTGNSLTRNIFGDFSYHQRTSLFWTMVVDDTLAQTPLAALPSPAEPNRLLLETNTVRLVPSAICLRPTKAPRWNRRAVGFADPVYNQADTRIDRGMAGARARDGEIVAVSDKAHGEPKPWELNRLPASAQELEQGLATLRSAGWQTRSASGPDATVAAMRDAVASGPDLLHVATHFSSDEQRPDLTGIALSSRDEQGKAELFSERDLVGLRADIKIVILDGCASAGGRSFPGVGIVGLSRGWLISGAANVVGTLWPILDEARPLFPVFYGELSGAEYDHRAAARALRTAQLAMLARRDRFAEPRHWAAYVAMGRN